jgi:hypothetical protein
MTELRCNWALDLRIGCHLSPTRAADRRYAEDPSVVLVRDRQMPDMLVMYWPVVSITALSTAAP